MVVEWGQLVGVWLFVAITRTLFDSSFGSRWLPSIACARSVWASVTLAVALVTDGVLEPGLYVWSWGLVSVAGAAVSWEGAVVESVRDASVRVVDGLCLV